MIHNNEEQRLHYLRGKLDELAVNLIRSGSEVVRMEIVNLPTKKFDTIVYVKRILKNEKYYIGKLKIRPIGKVLRVLRLLFSLILKFVLQVFKSAKKRDDFKRQFFRKLRIEDEVSRAHLKGLEEFLESKSDYLVVFESDSVVRDSEKLCNEINRHAKLTKLLEICLYNSHFSFEELGINHKNLPQNEGIEIPSAKSFPEIAREIPFLTTNTTCCYGMSRQLAYLLKSKIESQHQKGALPPPDWMFDEAFREIDKQNNREKRTSKSVFYFPTLVENGSLIGVYPSGIQ